MSIDEAARCDCSVAPADRADVCRVVSGGGLRATNGHGNLRGSAPILHPCGLVEKRLCLASRSKRRPLALYAHRRGQGAHRAAAQLSFFHGARFPCSRCALLSCTPLAPVQFVGAEMWITVDLASPNFTGRTTKNAVKALSEIAGKRISFDGALMVHAACASVISPRGLPRVVDHLCALCGSWSTPSSCRRPARIAGPSSLSSRTCMLSPRRCSLVAAPGAKGSR